MGYGKTILITFAMIGIISLAGLGYVAFAKMKHGEVQVLGTQHGDVGSMVNQEIIIPTLQESALIPTLDLVNCWQLAKDGTYEFDFGQMNREDCLEKVEEWKAENDKKLLEGADTGVKMEDKIFNSVPTLQPMPKEQAPQFTVQ